MKLNFITASSGLLLCLGTMTVHATTAHQTKPIAHYHSTPAQHLSRDTAGKSAPVLLNKANTEQLASIKGIGKKRAAAIIKYRDTHGQFNSLDQLTNIRGISANSLQRIMQKNPGKLRLG